MKHKILFALIPLWLMLQVAHAQNAGPSKHPRLTSESDKVEGFQYDVTADEADYVAGRPILIDVHLLNTTDTDLHLLPSLATETKMNIVVYDADGKSVPLTAYGQAGYHKPDFSRPYVSPSDVPYAVGPVPSHGELLYRILLNRLYDLSSAGLYAVIFKQWVPKQGTEGGALLASAPLRFSVWNDADTISPYPTNPNAHQSYNQGGISIR